MTAEDAQPEDDQILPLESLAEWLFDAAAAGDFATSLGRASGLLDDRAQSLDPMDLFRYRLLFFDLAQVSSDDLQVQQAAATELLSAAMESDASVWDAIRDSSRLAEIERLAVAAFPDVELLELLAYAPDPGMRWFAVSQIEAMGLRALDVGEESRTYERLLHAIGATDDAYRLEAIRKQRHSGSDLQRYVQTHKPKKPAFRVVAVAGGHAQLRGTAAELLARYGVQVVQIPSSREAVRRERDIVQLIQGCDLVLMLVRQITHSTSDQVRKAAARLRVPLRISHALSAVAIERELFQNASD